MSPRAETAQDIYQKDQQQRQSLNFNSKNLIKNQLFNNKLSLLLTVILSIIAGGLAGYLTSTYYLNQRVTTKPTNLTNQPIDLTKKIKIDNPEGIIINKLTQQLVGVYEVNKSGQWWQKIDLSGQFKGTAMIVTSDGWLLTSSAVINDFQKEYQVITTNNNYYLTKNFIQDKLTGLVFFKIEAQNLNPIQLADSQQLLPAQEIIILASNSQSREPQIKFSNIEKLKYFLIKTPKDLYHLTETQDEFILINENLANDFSGSLVANLTGEVIGIGQNIEQTNNFKTIVPANYLKQAIIKFLPTKTKVIRNYLGLDYLDLSQNLNLPANLTANKKIGILILNNKELGITAIKKDSPAKNFLKDGDIILKVNGQEIDEDNNFTEIIQNYNPNDKIKLLVYRQGEELEVEIILAEL